LLVVERAKAWLVAKNERGVIVLDGKNSFRSSSMLTPNGVGSFERTGIIKNPYLDACDYDLAFDVMNFRVGDPDRG
jgi:hypothetical protein